MTMDAVPVPAVDSTPMGTTGIPYRSRRRDAALRGEDAAARKSGPNLEETNDMKCSSAWEQLRPMEVVISE